MEMTCQTSDTLLFLTRVTPQPESLVLFLASLTSKFQKLSEKMIVFSLYDYITGMLSEENACPELPQAAKESGSL